MGTGAAKTGNPEQKDCPAPFRLSTQDYGETPSEEEREMPKLNDLVKVFEFEDQPLTVVMYNGKPAFVAKEVGERLGYTDGTKIAKNISQRWTDDFENGVDYSVLTGEELADFKQILKDNPVLVITGSSSTGSELPITIIIIHLGDGLPLHFPGSDISIDHLQPFFHQVLIQRLAERP